MKILLPTAKELNTNLDAQPAPQLTGQSQAVLEVMAAKTIQDLAQLYQIKPERATLEFDRWQRIKNGQAKAYPAWQLFDGLMYRYMKRRDLTSAESNYLKTHAYIVSPFYGIVNVFELMSPHRLDFLGKLTVNNISLKAFWQSSYEAVVAGDELLISLLSAEFEAVFTPQTRAHMVKIIFKEEKNGQLKVHSTISKKARGAFLSHLAQENIQDVRQLRQLKCSGYEFSSDASTDKNLVFIRKV